MIDRPASSSIGSDGQWIPKWSLVDGKKIEWEEPISLEQHLEQEQMDPTEEQSRRERRKVERKQRRLDRCCREVSGSRKRIGGVLDWLDQAYDEPNQKAFTQNTAANLSEDSRDGLARAIAESYREAAGVGPLTWWWIVELVIAVIKWWMSYRDETEE